MTARPNSNANIALLLVALFSLGACSSSGGDAVDSGNASTGGTADSGNSDGAVDAGGTEDNTTDGGASAGDTTAGVVFPTTGAYDLSEYLFHRNVLAVGGEISFVEKLFAKSPEDDENASTFISLNRSFVNNGGVIEESASGKLDKSFLIAATSIDETFASDGDFRQSQRFASVGEEYMNADSQPVNLGGQTIQQNATCVLQAHLETFDLSTATDRSLASGVYNDVLKIECKTGFISNGSVQPHTTLRSFHAKDIGVIFAEGNVFFFPGGDGNVYVIEEY